jgi:hypothetical protein
LIRGRPLRWLLLALVVLRGAPAAAQEGGGFAVRVGTAAEGWRALLQVPALLDDRGLADALGSGLPLRFRLRIELWEKGLFDRLADAQEISLALLQDPLDRSLTLETERSSRRYATAVDAQAAVRAALRPSVRPRREGRFYYLASLEVETLSLSDLEELERWLQGELQPAVSGQRPVPAAIGQGARRLLLRLLDLPQRRIDARSDRFQFAG